MQFTAGWVDQAKLQKGIAMMKTISLKVAVPNALLFIRDSRISDVPDVDYGDGSSVWSIPTCVVITCLIDSEGETDITLGAANQVKPSQKLLFDDLLETPSHKLILELIPDEKVLEVDLPSQKNRVRIWTDGRHQCAETVVIGIG
jgi:hypothetical protein